MTIHRTIRCSVLLASILTLLSADGAKAQRGAGFGRGSDGFTPPPAIGARIGRSWGWDVDVWTVGGHARIPLPGMPAILIAPSGDVLLSDGPNEWQINLDVALQLLPFAYGGGGFAIAKDSLPTSPGPTTETGYNLFVGLDLPNLRFPIRPFAELRWTEINKLVSPFRAVAGFIVPLGRSGSRRR